MEPEKKKIEWSKALSAVICLIFGIYGMWCGWQYYDLCRLVITTQMGEMPDPTLAITCVTVVISSLISYLTYNGFLKGSRNKHHLGPDGVPYFYEEYDSNNDDNPTIVG